MTTQLYFEKISKFDRAREPVAVSVPFAEGSLDNAGRICVRDEQGPLPLQRRALAHWPDGSIKWVLLHMQPDLPGNKDAVLQLEVAADPEETTPDAHVTLAEEGRGIRVDTGVLAFTVPRTGFQPVTEVSLNGEALWAQEPCDGLTMEIDGELMTTAGADVELEVEESGPLCAVISVKGKHRREDGADYMGFRGRITAFAGKPFIEVEYQFIHVEEEGEVTLEELVMPVRPPAAGTVRCALGEGYYGTRIRESKGDELDMSIDTDTILYQSNEHFIDSFYGDFWCNWRDDSAGLAVSVYQAHQNFPKRLSVDREGIRCYLFPSGTPAALYQGVAKTHRVMLHFHASDLSLEEISTRSLQFQLPDRPALPREWYRDNNPWAMDFFPERLPKRLITRFNTMHDGRPRAHGMLHFGDAPDAGYTDQGRGRGEAVWVNNEYDRTHSCALYYALTGQRRVLDSGLVSARHWLDVDLCHHSSDPLRDGGLITHSANHVSAGVTPSHEWVEGFLDHYYLTGRKEGLDAAHGVAANIMRHTAQEQMREAGASSVRENGWALRAMVAMTLATDEDRYKEESRRIARLLLAWHNELGGLLAPYTSHSMPRVVFMNALTANSLARYLAVDDDADVKQLVVHTIDDLIEHCLGPDGLFYYKELPSLRRTAPTTHALETLTHAYRITGERRYMEIATRQFAAIATGALTSNWVGKKRADTSGAVVQGEGGGRGFASSYTSLLIYAGTAAELGMLDWFEYPFPDTE